MKIRLVMCLMLLSVIVYGQTTGSYWKVQTTSEQFFRPLYANTLVRIVDTALWVTLTHDVLATQSMKTVFDSGWYKLDVSGGGGGGSADSIWRITGINVEKQDSSLQLNIVQESDGDNSILFADNSMMQLSVTDDDFRTPEDSLVNDSTSRGQVEIESKAPVSGFSAGWYLSAASGISQLYMTSAGKVTTFGLDDSYKGVVVGSSQYNPGGLLDFGTRLKRFGNGYFHCLQVTPSYGIGGYAINGANFTTSGIGVNGQSGSGTGVKGDATSGIGVYGVSSTSGTGVMGQSITGFQFQFGNDKNNTYDSTMIMDAAGNVGIGVTNRTPATKLDVNGVITATGGTSTTWNTAYGWGNHAGLYPPLADSSKWQYNGNDIWYTNGKMGIGTTAPSQALDVSGNIRLTGYIRRSNLFIGNSAATALYNNSVADGYIGFPASHVVNINNANLGIGTTAPASTLHVAGSARVSDSSKLLGKVYMTGIPDKGGAGELCRDASTGEISYIDRVSRHTASGDSIPTSALAPVIYLDLPSNKTFNDATYGGIMEGLYDGQQVTIINIDSTYTATFKVSSNVLDEGGSDVTVAPSESIVLIWDAEVTVWRFVNKTPSI